MCGDEGVGLPKQCPELCATPRDKNTGKYITWLHPQVSERAKNSAMNHQRPVCFGARGDIQ